MRTITHTYLPDYTKNISEKSLIETLVAQHGSPLMLLDCDVIRRQYRALANALPNVTLHFALKPLPHLAIVKALLDEGACFDLASNGEIDILYQAAVPASKTIQSHPIKRDSDIRYALQYGCNVFVVDNLNELEKFIPYRHRAEILIRLSFRNPEVFSDLSKKFGCTAEQAVKIIEHAYSLGIRVKGLSFHIGSQATKPDKYVQAIKVCADIFLRVSQMGLPTLSTLDIGGGFPVEYTKHVLPIDTFCAPIRAELEKWPDTVKIIAEPGRFIAAPAVTSIASVMGQAEREGKTWYYLDDGIYGSFSGIFFDHGEYPLDALNWNGERYPSVLAGPTCDSIDVICENIALPKLANGDLIIGRVMGAYTCAAATDFNLFKKAEIIVLNDTFTAEHKSLDIG